MPTPGQPTLYKPEYCELAHNYCLLGATNQVLAGFFRVAPAPSTTGSPPIPTSPTRCIAAAPSPTHKA
jgi:hypothetical protein